jgi:pilus assembly protein CpaC
MASVLCIATGLFALAPLALALALAPALAAGRSKTTSVVLDGLSDSSLVQLLVTVDKARTVGCDQEFAEILVANPLIADVIALSNKQVYVLGKKAGITSISLVGTNKKVIGLVNVEVAHDLDGLTRRLRKFVPGGEITVTSVNGKVLLTGTVPDTPALSRALAIAEQVAPGAVTNAMSVRGSQQVQLEVRFIEATRDSERDLGVDWAIIGSKDAKGNVINGGAHRPADQPGAGRRGRRAGAGQRHDGGCADPGAGEARRRTPAGGAEPDGAVGRHRELPRWRRVPVPGPGR